MGWDIKKALKDAVRSAWIRHRSERPKRHWQRLYRGKPDGEQSWFKARPEVSLELIARANLPKTAPIIDVGGGASTLVDHLLDAGYRRLSVLDISAAAMAISRERLGERAAEVTWIERDIAQFQDPGRYALWHDWATFHFFVDHHARERYLEVMRQHLDPIGHLIIATFAWDGPRQCDGLPVKRYDPETLHEFLGKEFKLLEARHEVHLTPGGIEQKFLYAHFRRSRG
ncbi:MAG: class I SAM-dependent methyltransferase [Magnetococcales bacterium]|nr:class I SAM-dependent methyltransferase [Magnetococcales bacterium]MBF0155947.1 class I SAM-dependent methyltransferase [Magnetococcales bacterium]